jgi:hypothetical protein
VNESLTVSADVQNGNVNIIEHEPKSVLTEVHEGPDGTTFTKITTTTITHVLEGEHGGHGGDGVEGTHTVTVHHEVVHDGGQSGSNQQIVNEVQGAIGSQPEIQGAVGSQLEIQGAIGSQKMSTKSGVQGSFKVQAAEQSARSHQAINSKRSATGMSSGSMKQSVTSGKQKLATETVEVEGQSAKGSKTGVVVHGASGQQLGSVTKTPSVHDVSSQKSVKAESKHSVAKEEPKVSVAKEAPKVSVAKDERKSSKSPVANKKSIAQAKDAAQEEPKAEVHKKVSVKLTKEPSQEAKASVAAKVQRSSTPTRDSVAKNSPQPPAKTSTAKKVSDVKRVSKPEPKPKNSEVKASVQAKEAPAIEDANPAGEGEAEAEAQAKIGSERADLGGIIEDNEAEQPRDDALRMAAGKIDSQKDAFAEGPQTPDTPLPQPEDAPEDPAKGDLDEAIDQAADALPSNQDTRQASDSQLHKDSRVPEIVNVPKKKSTRARPSTQPQTGGAAAAETIGQAQKKLNLRQQLDLMNEKLKYQSRPLNYYDHSHYNSLNVKRATPVVQLDPDLTPEQKEKIRERLLNEKSAKVEQERQKSQERLAQIERKKQENDEEAAALKQKIEAILEKKLNEKKQQEKLGKSGKYGEGKVVETKLYGVTIGTVPVETVRSASPGYAFLKKGKGSPGKQSPVKAAASPKEVGETLPLKSTTNSNIRRAFKPVKPKDPAAFMSYQDKNNIFTYNLELKNKNVNFKKLAWNPEQYIKAANGARSPSPTPKSVNVTGQVSTESQPRTQRFKKAQNAAVYASPEIDQTTRSVATNQLNVADLLRAIRDQPIDQKKAQIDLAEYPKLNDFIQKLAADGQKPSNKAGIDLLDNFQDKIRDEDLGDALELVNLAEIEGDDSLKPALRAEVVTHAAAQKKPQLVKQGLIDLYQNLAADPEKPIDEDVARELTLALAELEAEGGSPANGLKLYKQASSKPGVELPEKHQAALDRLLSQPANAAEAADYYESQIDSNIADSFRHLDITKLFLNISKTVELLAQAGDTKRLARFYLKVIGALRRIKGLHSALHTAEQDYENLVECFVLNTLRFANRSQNFGLSNFIIGEALKSGHVDLANMNEDEKQEFAALIAEFCWRLKDLPDYGGFKETYMRYLTHAKQVVKQCDLNADNLRLSLLINFNRGVFYLKEGNARKAHALFDKCLLTYYAFFKEADQDLYQVLFNLGEALWSKGRRADSFYFFNRVLDEQCLNDDLKKAAKERLGQIQFHGEEPESSKASLEPFLDEHFEARRPANFYRLLCLHFLACEKTSSDDFQKYFKRLGELPPAALSQEVYWYFKMFKQFQRVYEEHHNYKENKRFMSLIEEIGKDDGGDAALNAKRLVNTGAFVFSEFVGGAKQGIKVNEQGQASQASQAKAGLIDAFYDQFLTVEENAVVVARYLLNLILVFLHLVPLFNERTNNQQARQKVFEQVERAVPVEELQNEIYNAVRASAAEARKNSTKNFQPVAKAGAEGADSDESKIPKVNSAQVLVGGPADPNSWTLENEFGGNAQLQALVKDFLKQVKNMLFLDVVENVLTYYLRFEASLIELGLNYPKYNFIKQMIRLHLAKPPKKPIEKQAFVSLLDQLFGAHNVSVADLKLLVILLEAFKDIDYLRLLALYLDQYHKVHARLFLRDLSFEQFLRKADFVSGQLFQQVAQAKYFELENCYFMHYLESQHFINLAKELRFKVFLRSRHDLLNDPAFRQVITEYVTPAELAHFDLRFHTYTAIVKRVKGGDGENQRAFKDFGILFEEALSRYVPEDAKTVSILYDLVLLATLMDARSGAISAEILLAVLNKLSSGYRGLLAYPFSRVYSMVGNVFFKYGHNQQCKQAKLRAQELLAEDAKSSPGEPAYAPACTREQHQFQILSFLLMCHLEEGDLKAAVQLGERLEKWTVTDQGIQFNRLILRALLNLKQDKTSEPLKNVYEAISLFGKMKLNDFLNRMYQAILDKITLLVIERSQSHEEVQVVQKKSRVSIAKLYDLPSFSD